MDEPIGALDAKLREDMRTELKRLHIENGIDHRLRHARPGRGDVARRPDRDHERGRAAAGRHADGGLPAPGNLFVAQFIGSPVMNVLPAAVQPKAARTTAVARRMRRGLRFPGALPPPLDAQRRRTAS